MIALAGIVAVAACGAETTIEPPATAEPSAPNVPDESTDEGGGSATARADASPPPPKSDAVRVGCDHASLVGASGASVAFASRRRPAL